MSLNMEEGPLKEAAILTRAVENVFRKIIRLLVGRMSLTRLQEMIRIIFVEEAELKLQKERPGESVSLSSLGAMTGLDTRTLKSVRKHLALTNGLSDNKTFLDGFNPLLRVVDLWLNDPRFFDKNTNTPKQLRTVQKEGESSFSDLVAESLNVRGVTPGAVLQRLKQNNLVENGSLANTIRLKEKKPIFLRKDVLEMIEIGLETVSRLLSTLEHNIEIRNDVAKLFFQRSYCNYQISVKKVAELRKQIHSFLLESDNEGRKVLTSFAERERASNQLTAGVGMFYFEETPFDFESFCGPDH